MASNDDINERETLMNLMNDSINELETPINDGINELAMPINYGTLNYGNLNHGNLNYGTLESEPINYGTSERETPMNAEPATEGQGGDATFEIKYKANGMTATTPIDMQAAVDEAVGYVVRDGYYRGYFCCRAESLKRPGQICGAMVTNTRKCLGSHVYTAHNEGSSYQKDAKAFKLPKKCPKCDHHTKNEHARVQHMRRVHGCVNKPKKPKQY
ncbi:hypothetical protein BJ170DRAFT_683554 [Xylariales sp. AK1849]|nr:hypothetical protein BJ170DRAFT_683554 [Xylariales sp. AK1849]